MSGEIFLKKRTKESIIQEMKDGIIEALKNTYEEGLQSIFLSLTITLSENKTTPEEIRKLSKEMLIFNLEEHIKLIKDYKWE
jgi:hypothetical protein